MKHASPAKWHRKVLSPVTLTSVLTAAVLVGGVGLSATAAELSAAPTAASSVSSHAVSMWGTTAPQGASVDTDRGSVELGTAFTAKVDGTVTGIKFWKTKENKGTHVGNLWDASGKRLAKVTFTGETDSGWQTAILNKPVALKADAKYTVSYLAPKGRYVSTEKSSFTSASPDILATSKNGGVYRYGADSKFPTKTWNSSNYWVDVLFAPTGEAAKPPVDPETPPVAPVDPPVKPTDPPVEPVVPPVTPPTEPPVTPPTEPSKPAPSDGSFAGASNTGPAAAGFNPTQKYTGPRTITTPGTVISNQIIPAGLIVKADDVTIQGNIISGSTYVPGDEAAIHVTGKRVRILDNEIRGESASDWRQTPASGLKLFGDDFQVERNNMYWIGGDAVTVVGQNAKINKNWIHDFTARDGVHYDGIVWGSDKISTPAEVRDNTVEMWIPGMMTATISLPTDAPKMIVDHNVFAGGGYTLFGGGGGTTITNNLFWTKFAPKAGAYGPKAYTGSVVWSNNAYSSNGQTAGALIK